MDEDLESLARERLIAEVKGCIHYRQSLDRQLPDAPRSTAEPYPRNRRKR